MARLYVLLGLLTATALWPQRSRAGGEVIVVIVHKANPVSRLGRDDLRPIYLLKKTAWGNGRSIEPFNLPDGANSRSTFDRAVLGMGSDEVARYWIDRRIRGDARPPRNVPSPSTIVALVAKNEDAIGYVPAADVKGSVKIVARVEAGQVVAP
jgi:ABC-type phosphate transport system substrate-binding protein